ncbi:MAG TPA: DNA-directed RNA polymerase subunit beta', partial [Ktedonobacterales bacterium]|nr:DNA-directed RNA polymerase subunit beta' [Ktedonobacterales bacterium]
KRVRFKGIVCDKCGVEVARSKVRRERMGHIELASPVSHIWYFKGTPSRIGLLLDLSPRNLERILYFALYVVTSVNEEARGQALANIDQAIQRRIAELEESVRGQIEDLQARRDATIAELEQRATDRRGELEDQRTQSLMEARTVEGQLKSHLKANKGKALAEDVVYLPTGERIAQMGEVVDDVHQSKLEHVVQEHRELIASSTQSEIDRLAAETERETERARMNTEGEITAIQDKLQQQVKENEAQTETSRRDLEALKRLDLLQEQRYRELRDLEFRLRQENEDLPDIFEAGMGAEAVQELLEGIDLEELAAKLRTEIATTSGQRRKKATKRLNVVEAFRKSGNHPDWMILSVLPVLPPDLRPMVQLDGGRFATSDLNDLYRRVINRNNRLKRLLELGAPEIIIRNEKRMLQEACDALIDNGRRGRAVAGSGNHKLKSLSDMLKGKQGRFRQNLLGKRVDYSGRSVIVVGPNLKLHQCGLPKKMALELFKPFVMRKLVEHQLAHNIKSAKRFVERVRPEVWDVLEEVIKDHPVLLNRAPTLHRLGIQAFEAVLIEGNAIQLHPLVCSSFNADFDGDQMAVHVPLSERAQDEARTLMLSAHNILTPATGEPTIGASQEMVLGAYYLTMDRAGLHGEGRVFTDTTEALLAYDAKVIALHARIKVRLSSGKLFNEPGVGEPLSASDVVETTVGRIIFNDALPEGIRFKNYPMKKENLRQIVAECFKYYGRPATAKLADDIKRLGFTYATQGGQSIAISDVPVPSEREDILNAADAKIGQLEDDFRDGLITDQERYRQAVKIWNDATDEIQKLVQRVLDPYGPIYTIANSGATKAKFQQIRQLSGMRGLMADPSGRIMEIPVRGNFRDGLNVMEYFISSHGARKGLADTALRTAESGYLTRRLIDVAQDVIVLAEDCGTDQGIWITERDSRDMNEPFKNRLTGRILQAKVPGFDQYERGVMIEDDMADAFIEAGVKEVYCRSVLQCAEAHGVCRLCYGRNLAAGELVNIGDAVGIIAAQSIGEPGTQLTMRTFHTGGIAGAQEDITQGLPRVEELFEARTPKEKAIVSEIDGVVEIELEETGVRKAHVIQSQAITEDYSLPRGAEALVSDGQAVAAGEPLYRTAGSKHAEPETITAREPGIVKLAKNAKTITVESRVEERREYQIPAATNIIVTDGEQVRPGQPLTNGLIDPQDVLHIQGREAVHLYLVQEVQKVYRSTGVYINDKHIEIIVRQMLRRVRVDEPGDTDLLPNDLVDRFHYEETNARTLAEGGEPATAQTVLLGVTKASLNTDSFLAAASFQETTRVLTEAAINGLTDHLRGLKENVIIGKLIPAGTGLPLRRELRDKQRADRLAAMQTPGLGTLGLGGPLGGENSESSYPDGYDNTDYGDLPSVDSDLE